MKSSGLLAISVLVLTAACGSNNSNFSGSGGGAGSDGGGSGGTAGGSSGGSGGTATGGSGGTSAGGSGGMSTGGSSGAGGTSTGGSGGAAGNGGSAGDGGAGCPGDVYGNYTVVGAVGTCGDINTNAPQKIAGTPSACFGHFVSVVDGGTGAVNGGVNLDSNGNFAGAKLYLGTNQRQPCTGTWNAATSTMTIACGGTGDLCTVVLKHN